MSVLGTGPLGAFALGGGPLEVPEDAAEFVDFRGPLTMTIDGPRRTLTLDALARGLTIDDARNAVEVDA